MILCKSTKKAKSYLIKTFPICYEMINFSNISKLSKRNQICKGVSLSADIWLQIDKDKGDISRNRFIQRLIEKAYLITTGDNKNE